MTLDEIIKKYGTHDLDIDCVKEQTNKTVVYAYCHQHEKDGCFIVNHYLKIIGKFSVLKKQCENEKDICIHIATIEKKDNDIYEIGGVGDCFQFQIDSDLCVNELTEKEYYKQILRHNKSAQTSI